MSYLLYLLYLLYFLNAIFQKVIKTKLLNNYRPLACNDSDNCLSNATQENYIDPKENKPVNSSNTQEENSLDSLRKLRLRNVNKVIIGNININSLPAKFDQVKEVILKNVDILVITKTKLDDTFPLGQFYVDVFTMPYRLDRNCNGCNNLCQGGHTR